MKNVHIALKMCWILGYSQREITLSEVTGGNVKVSQLPYALKENKVNVKIYNNSYIMLSFIRII